MAMKTILNVLIHQKNTSEQLLCVGHYVVVISIKNILK